MKQRFGTTTPNFRLPGVVALAVSLSCGGLMTSRAAGSHHPYAVQHWSSDQGLPPGPGSAVLQSRDGHIWFGMEEGLGRFNGSDCEVFDSFNTPAMKGNAISVLFEDHAGALWIGNGTKGLLRLRNGEFERFGPDMGLSNDAVSAIAEDRAGTLWVGTDGGGLFRFDQGKFAPVILDERAESLFVNDVATTPDGAVWVIYKNSLRRIRGNETRLFGQDELTAGNLYSLHVDRRGQLWIGGTDFLGRAVEGRIEKVNLGQPSGRISSISSAPNGTLWLGTSHGVIRKNGDEIERFDTSNGLSGNLITYLIVDREGSVWMCENSNGIDQLKPSRFEVIGTSRGLSHPTVTSILEDSKGAMWIATEDGLNRFVDGKPTVFKREQGLSWNMIFTLAEDPEGAIWVGTWDGLNRFQNGKFTRFGGKDGLPISTIWCSYRDHDGTMWFGTPKGLVQFREGGFKTLNHDNSGLSHDDVRCILRDSKGRLWVGTSYGLNRRSGGRFENFFKAAEDQSFNVVLTLHEDDEGGIWFGTQGDGLFLYREGRFTRFSTADGLFDNLVHKILEDDSANLWLTSNRGLFCVSRSQLEAVARGELKRVSGRVFDKHDGLPTAQFNGTIQPAGWKARDGRLWFASMAGAVVADPNRMYTNFTAPAVSIESMELNGKAKPVHPGTVVVPPGTERIGFSYAVLSYVSPGALKSRYRLDGFDKGWVTNTVRHEAQYTRLRPGEYRFRVAAANGDGIWNDEGATLAIFVQPFIWQTGWFQAGAGVLGMALLVWSVHAWAARSHRLELEAVKRRHALESERTRISSDLHDDVGSNLGSISLLSREALRRVDDDVATDLSEISRLAQETSDAMRDIVWFINPNEDTVEKMSLRMKDTAASLLGGVRFVFEAPTLAVDASLSPQFKRQFFLIFKESLHNISKHAGATDVVIRLLARPGKLDLEVQDNGAGFREAEANHGNGLASMRRRAADQRWRFGIESIPGQGTKVRLSARFD